MKAGEWLGPWVLCHTLEAVMKKMEPASLNVHVHVVSQPGGAVPVLYTARCTLHYPSPLCSVQTMGLTQRLAHVFIKTMPMQALVRL